MPRPLGIADGQELDSLWRKASARPLRRLGDDQPRWNIPGPSNGHCSVEIPGTFPGTLALDSVDLDVREGEIHGLVGGNGSGKSTLIKILTGVYQADGGARVVIKGEAIDAADITPEFARRVGIHVVHQDLGVFLDLSVTENLALGHGYKIGRGTEDQLARDAPAGPGTDRAVRDRRQA